MMKTTGIAVMMALTLSACASSSVGNKFDQGKANGFMQGKATYTEIVQTLGKPQTVTTGANGSKSITYSYAHAEANAASYIPFVNLFAAKMDSESQTAAFSFDKNDILISKTISEVKN